MKNMETKHTEKKELILQAAEQLFAKKGFYGLGLTELLKQCEIPKGSFYYYFPDGKIQLIQEVLRYSYGKMEKGIVHYILTEDTACASFERMAQHLASCIEARTQLPSMLLSMIGIESVYLDEGVNVACRQIYDDWQKLYADTLLRFGFDEWESRVKAQALFALIHGSLISSWIKQNPKDLLMAKETVRLILGER